MQEKAVASVIPMRSETTMPISIAKAIIEAIKKIESADATGKGEEANTARRFQYASINDVLKAASGALNDAGLTALPIEVEYTEESVNGTHLLARYSYRFRLIHKDGGSWVDEQDTRHVTLAIDASGMNAGKAQSLAMRDYYKGLLRIRTREPDDEAAENVSHETIQRSDGRQVERKGTIPFDFGEGGMAYYSVEDIRRLFDEKIIKLKASQRKQWEAANVEGIRALNEAARPTWLHIRSGLDKN